MDTQKYIIDLLARGMSPANAAQIAGVTPSYVSQLCTQDDFANELAQMRSKYAAERDERQEKVQKIHDDYLHLEQKVLKQLNDSVGLMRPGEKIKLLQVLSGKKEPPPTIDPTKNSGLAPVVTIQMPIAIAAQFVMNSQKEILGMNNGTVFAPMSTKALNQEAKEHEQKQQALAAPQRQEQINSAADIMGLFKLEAQDPAIQL